ncbi:chemotaxis protein CheW [Persephonella sp.]
MKINLLEFKVDGQLFGIRTEYIKNIFEVESIKQAPLFPEYVCGLTVHGKYIFPLISLRKILELSHKSENPLGKTAVTVNVSGKYFSLLVDEILKIQEIEKKDKDSDIINFYNLKGEVLEEITPEFLSLKVKIPPLKQTVNTDTLKKLNNKKEDEENFLVFNLNEKLFGINTDCIKKVEFVESLVETVAKEDEWIEGIFLLRDIPIKTGNLKKLLNLDGKSGDYLIIIEKDKNLFGFLVDNIIDIFPVKNSKINRGSSNDSYFRDYVVYNGSVIPILSPDFIKNILEKYSLKVSDIENHGNNNKTDEIDVLIFRIGSENLGIKMENVDEVIEFKDIHLSNYPTENKAIKGIMALNDESLFLISYEDFLNQKIDIESEEVKVLIIKDGELKIGLLISDILDLISVTTENFALFESDSSFILGTVLHKKEGLINLINPRWIISEFSAKKEDGG